MHPHRQRIAREQEAEARFVSPASLLRPLRLGDVTQKRAEEDGLSRPHRRDRELHRKLGAVSMQGGQLDPPAEHRAFAGGPKSRQASLVGFAVGRGDDRFGEESTEDLRLSPAKEALRLRVPARDPALDVDRDDGIQRMGDEEAEALLALSQRLLGSPALADLLPHRCGQFNLDRRGGPVEPRMPPRCPMWFSPLAWWPSLRRRAPCWSGGRNWPGASEGGRGHTGSDPCRPRPVGSTLARTGRCSPRPRPTSRTPPTRRCTRPRAWG